ncbi:MAG: class I SAM-dependent methyltransferase [Sphingobacteriales bacterium]|jgi:2-polyprenyl-3-methyl-5-hydroxy-6-metoxy-1,4-benzoquinol methylase|nr:class I SAM-dependent methyltransferase [Sphingobacteriales bacterium]
MNTDYTQHWETVYQTKQTNEVSWTQDVPQTSLDFIHSFNLPKSAKIIDIGGGDSKLVDYLLEEGFENITVLDISSTSLERARKRLGDKAAEVTWIVSDITSFQPQTTYDLWHDRAVFHFLTSPEQIAAYKKTVEKAVNGFMIIGSFSEQGPKKCSGLDICQYSTKKLEDTFKESFTPLHCLQTDHITPFQTSQNFVFCSFEANK